MTIHYTDQNGDDPFLWHVQYSYVPAGLFTRVGESHGSRVRGGQRRTIGSGKSVIRGFHVNFHPYFTGGSDHHIRELGVLTPDDGRVEVFYSDQNADDGFDWSVNWGILHEEVVPGGNVGVGQAKGRNSSDLTQSLAQLSGLAGRRRTRASDLHVAVSPSSSRRSALRRRPGPKSAKTVTRFRTTGCASSPSCTGFTVGSPSERALGSPWGPRGPGGRDDEDMRVLRLCSTFESLRRSR
jgi:hypothetical protein